MSEPIPNWAILCGKVRDPAACLRKLRTLAHWKRDGLLDGIVMATWIGELDAYPEIGAALDSAESLVVEIAEPTLRLPGHVLHQMLAIHYALDLVPDGARVLRLRPDLIDLSDQMAALLRDPQGLAAAPPAGWPAILDERLVVLEGFALSPFYINDMTFYGRASDLRRLLGMDLRAEVLFSHHAPEQWFFAHPFLAHLPILHGYFPLAAALRFNDPAWSRRYIALHLDSPFFVDVLVTYLLCLRSFFRIGFADDEAAGPDAFAEITATDALLGDAVCPGLVFRENLRVPIVRHGCVVDAILDGRFAPDALTERVQDALPRVRDWSWQAAQRTGMLRTQPALRHFQDDVGLRLGTSAPRADSVLDPAGRRFRVAHAGDRWQVLNATDEVRALQDENNGLRRTVDLLQGQLTRQAQSRG